jgi:hypothetical protein
MVMVGQSKEGSVGVPKGEGVVVVGEVCLICTLTRGFHEQVGC